jgi:hypothetical protein
MLTRRRALTIGGLTLVAPHLIRSVRAAGDTLTIAYNVNLPS